MPPTTTASADFYRPVPTSHDAGNAPVAGAGRLISQGNTRDLRVWLAHEAGMVRGTRQPPGNTRAAVAAGMLLTGRGKVLKAAPFSRVPVHRITYRASDLTGRAVFCQGDGEVEERRALNFRRRIRRQRAADEHSEAARQARVTRWTATSPAWRLFDIRRAGAGAARCDILGSQRMRSPP